MQVSTYRSEITYSTLFLNCPLWPTEDNKGAHEYISFLRSFTSYVVKVLFGESNVIVILINLWTLQRIHNERCPSLFVLGKLNHKGTWTGVPHLEKVNISYDKQKLVFYNV